MKKFTSGNGTRRNKGEKRKVSCKKKLIWILGMLVVLVVLGKILIPKIMFPDFEPVLVTGQHSVQTSTYTWVDEDRVETYTDTGEKRALTVKFWYPVEEGEYPLVVFSHGAFGVIDSNNSTCNELASNGYVVASIGHPYHAMFVEDVNGKTTMVDMDFMKQVYSDNGADTDEAERAVYEFSKEWIEVRTGDMHFVLDTILEKAEGMEEVPFRLINTDHIGLFGHSMGGATAVQIGRERKDIDAVIDLEGTMAGEYVDFEKGYELYNEEPYQVPVLDVNSKAVRDQIDALEREHADANWKYVNDYLGENAADYREVIFYGAGHLNFTDLPLFSRILAKMLGVGEVDARTCIEDVNEVVLLFFNDHLKGEDSSDLIKDVYGNE